MIALWIVVLVGGVVVTALASRRAVADAIAIAEGLGASTGLVGVTLVAVGTDLPEIANSISASISGHGDLVVGDATGSALTQVTLILAILIAVSPSLVATAGGSGERLVAPTGVITVGATLVIAVVVADGTLSRGNGAVLVLIWIASMLLISRWHRTDRVASDRPERDRASGVGRRSVTALVWLGLVGLGATAVVHSFVEITEQLGAPQLIASTIVLALGTSLPELVVDLTAIRRGAAALAIGDLFGSSLVDTTLSIGIGPMIRTTEVSSGAVISAVIVAIAIAAATAAWFFGPRRRAALATTYAAIYVLSMGAIVVAVA